VASRAGFGKAHQIQLGSTDTRIARSPLSESEADSARHGNLSTHTISSLYETFAPEQALSLAKRLEIHYTPKHGSWLNIAEIELSALTIQCLSRRIASMEELQREAMAWEVERNKAQKSVDWQLQMSRREEN
jgi:hypothetical protein